MNHLLPLELLKERLDEYERALKKSEIAFKEGGIDLKTHKTHIKNLAPLILGYTEAISVIVSYQKLQK